MKTEVVGGQVHAVVDAFTADDRFDNDLESKLTVQGPEPGRRVTSSYPLRQTAPGRYEASFPLDRYGSFVLRAEHARRTDDGRMVPVAVSYGPCVEPLSPGVRELRAQLGAFESRLGDDGCHERSRMQRAFDPSGESVTFHEDLWPKFVALSIVLLLFDLLVRRVRLFDRKFVPRARAA